MTPKEKAKDIVDKMIDEIPPNNSKDMMTFIEVDLQASKQCALIAVDEILNNDGFTRFDQYLTEYWQEVKHEIEQL